MNRSDTFVDKGNVASITTPSVANPRPYFPSSFAVTESAAGLERIFDDGVSVCIWRRPTDIAIDAYLDKAMPAFGRGRGRRRDLVEPEFTDRGGVQGEVGCIGEGAHCIDVL